MIHVVAGHIDLGGLLWLRTGVCWKDLYPVMRSRMKFTSITSRGE